MQHEAKSAITILVAEPLNIVRAGLCALLANEPGFAVVGETDGGTDIVDLVGRLKPDILLLEPQLAGASAPQTLSSVKGIHPDLKVLLLADPHDEATVMALLETGAVSCFLKSDRQEEFLRGIRAAADGELSMSSTAARWLLKRLPGHQRSSLIEPLTEREREVLGLLTDGLSNKEIAQKLYLSVRTVEVHLRNIYGKLGVRSRLEAVTRSLGQSQQEFVNGQGDNT